MELVKEIRLKETRHLIYYDEEGRLCITSIRKRRRKHKLPTEVEEVVTVRAGDPRFMNKVEYLAKYWPGIRTLALFRDVKDKSWPWLSKEKTLNIIDQFIQALREATRMECGDGTEYLCGHKGYLAGKGLLDNPDEDIISDSWYDREALEFTIKVLEKLRKKILEEG